MATLHIDEYNAKGESYSKENGRSPDTVYPKLVTTQDQITTSGSSQVSDPVNEATAFVSIRAVGGDVYIKIGKTPTASNSPTGGSKYLADGEPWDVDVDPGEKIAVIDA